jgi:hypothetical protein
MKKMLALVLMLAAAGGALLFGAGSSSLLSPKPPAIETGAPSPAQKADKRLSRPDSGAILQARGRILKVHPADRARKTAEWIVLLVGKKRLSVVVYDSASIRDGKGTRLNPALLKAGETVSLSYRQKGNNRTALAIRA